MKSIDERLVDSNPVTGGYVPANYEQLVTSIVRHTPLVDRAWRQFRVRMASSVVTASALTVLGVSALNGAGAALPVLGFSASASHAPRSPGQKVGTSAPGRLMMPIMLNYAFEGGANFSSAPGSAPVYALGSPSDLPGTLQAVATSLGVTLANTVPTSNSSTYYAVSGAQYSASISRYGARDDWNIYPTPSNVTGVSGVSGVTGTSGPVTSPTPAPVGVTGATRAAGGSLASGVTGPSGPTAVVASGPLARQALHYVQALGAYSAGSATQVNLFAGQTTVNVPLLINGYPSDMSDSFTFNRDGTVQSASGSLFSLSTVATYPLISPSAGVEQITVQEGLFHRFVAYGMMTPMATSHAPSQSPNASPRTQMATGTTGTTGATGAVGTPGTPKPPVTAPGPSGVSGTSGVSGVAGVSGTSGVTGVSGTVPTTTVPPTTLVNLTNETLRYASYDMKGDVWMELPVYDYTGTVVQGGYPVSFTVVPLPSQYLDFAPTVLPMGAR